MRIIGINILKDTAKTLRKCLKPGWYPFCDSSLEDCHGFSWPRYNQTKVPDDFFRVDNSVKIKFNIAAVVGKNGTGKSTIVELLLAVINNVSARLSKISNKEFIHRLIDTYVRDIYADVYYEIEEIAYCIQMRDTQISVLERNGKSGEISLLTEDGLSKSAIKDFLSQHFFYTVAFNYGIYSFSSDNARNHIEKGNDIHRTLWFDSYFHRVDGYSIPLTLVPDRNKGVIDINNEVDLARKRLAKIALWLKFKNGKSLIKGYEPCRLVWIYKEWKDEKTKSLIDPLLHGKASTSKQKAQIDDLYWRFRRYWNSKLDNKKPDGMNEQVFFSAINYLVYKTIKICVNHQKYGELLFKDGDSGLEYDNIGGIVDELMVDDSHIATKVRAVISYLSSKLYTSERQSASVDELWEMMKGKTTLQEVEMILPPPFFFYDMEYSLKGQEEGVTIDVLSSGEKQMIFSVSAAIEHLANLSSISTNDSSRIAYHHVNLVFDEAELYFHPEFQRIFIYKLLSILSSGFIDGRRIKSVNILFVTHSPYLLSDIPAQNILFLGDKEDENFKTLAANIYDLLKNGFFMDSSIGELSALYLQRIIAIENIKDDQKMKTAYLKEQDTLRFFVNEIGDPYLRNFMAEKLRHLDLISMSEPDIERMIKEHYREIERLKHLKE